MLKARREAMDAVAAKLFPAEAAIDDAICASARLLEAMVMARRHANLSAVVGHEAIVAGIATLEGLRAARDQVVTAHHALASTRDQLGLGAVAIGGSGDKPPLSSIGDGGEKPSAEAPTRRLRAVR